MEALMSFFANIDWLEIWLATGDTLLMLGGSLLFTNLDLVIAHEGSLTTALPKTSIRSGSRRQAIFTSPGKTDSVASAALFSPQWITHREHSTPRRGRRCRPRRPLGTLGARHP